MQGRTTFHFVTGGFAAALEQARAAAGDGDVDMAGGASIVQQAPYGGSRYVTLTASGRRRPC
jgi:hypothetical protein